MIGTRVFLTIISFLKMASINGIVGIDVWFSEINEALAMGLLSRLIT